MKLDTDRLKAFANDVALFGTYPLIDMERYTKEELDANLDLKAWVIEGLKGDLREIKNAILFIEAYIENHPDLS